MPTMLITLVAVFTLTSCIDSSIPATSSPRSTTSIPDASTTAPKLPPSRTLDVPTGPAPYVDGVLNAGEWDDAATVEMSDGTQILWISEAETLFVAVRSNTLGSVNLALAQGDQIWILHSSAALGSAEYVKASEIWELVHGFGWCCRSSSNPAGRHALLEAEGWQANIGFTGDAGSIEYEVMLPWAGAVVAVSFVVDAETTSFWPVDLGRDAEAQLVGPRDSDLAFVTTDWFTLNPLSP